MSVPYVCSRCRNALQRVNSKQFQTECTRSLLPFSNKEFSSSKRYHNYTSSYTDGRNDAEAAGAAFGTRRLRYSGRRIPDGLLREVLGKQNQPSGPSYDIQWTSNDFTATQRTYHASKASELFRLLQEEIGDKLIAINTANKEQRLKFEQREEFSPVAKKHLEVIELYAVEEARFKDAWEALKTLDKRKDELTKSDLNFIRRAPTMTKVLYQMANICAMNSLLGRTPSLVRLATICRSLQVIQNKLLNHLIGVALKTIFKTIYHTPSANQNKALGNAARLLEDVLQIWRESIHHIISKEQYGERGHIQWRCLPSLDALKDCRNSHRSSYIARFRSFLHGPDMRGAKPNTRRNLALDSLFTAFCYHKLKAAGKIEPHVVEEMGPFINFLNQLLTQLQAGNRENEDDPSHLIARAAGTNGSRIKKDIKIFFDAARRETFQPDTNEIRPVRYELGIVQPLGSDQRALISEKQGGDLSSGNSESKSTDLELEMPKAINFRFLDPVNKISALFSYIRKAAKEDDVRHMHRLWKKHEELSDGKDQSYMQMIYAEFLLAFARLRQVGSAVNVWITMKEKNIEPTIEHWVGMIRVCQVQKDLDSLNSIWKVIRQSDKVITNTAWTAYIDALVTCRDWRGVAKTVYDLGDYWDMRKRRPVNENSDADDTKDDFGPSMIPLNTAILGLIKLGKRPVADAVLAFSRRQGIKESIETFNILLRPAVRSSETTEVERILRELYESGLKPDIITFTTLLDRMLRNSDASFQEIDTPEQRSFMEKIFADMQSVGIQPTQQTYATMLDALLSNGETVNLAAAHALLMHMQRHEVKLSPHICSIIVIHYFNSNPPDLESVEALWQRMENEGVVPDHVFFDRLIENYARLGRTDKCLAYLKMMPARGKAPGWIALVVTLKALLKNEEVSRANDLIKSVEDGEGLGRLGIRRGWRGKGQWDALVASLRLKGLVSPASAGFGQEARIIDVAAIP